MGDPFVDLLIRFKEGESNSRGKMRDEGLLSGENPKHFAKQRSSKDALQPSVEESSNNSKIDDDLDKLFNITSHTNATDSEGKKDFAAAKRNQDDLNQAFDQLLVASEKSRQNVELKPTQVVDKARDMEVAKLMSLGYSIDDANASYDNNVLYDDLVAEAKQKKLRRRRLERQLAEARWENDNPLPTIESRNSGEGSVDLFSIASDILNKGKELVGQLSLFPEEEKDDTLQPYKAGRLRQKRFAKPALQNCPQKDYDLISGIQDEFPWNDMKSDSLLSMNQGGERGLSVSRPDKSATFDPPQLSGTLLDFDEAPVNSSSISIAATKQESQFPAHIVPITEIELSGYDEFRARAKELFKMGDYVTAIQEYEKTLNTLPQGHPLRIISYSNLMASQLKTGQYKESLDIASAALELFPEDTTAQWTQIIQNSEPARKYGDMWIKIVLRQAEAFEHLENYCDALKAYQSLVEKNFCTDKVMDGRRRCQKVLNPHKYKVIRKKPIDAENPLASFNIPGKEYGNLRNIKENNRKQAEEESQRHALYDKVYEQIKKWESTRANDIRHLLSTLQEILPWINWKPVSSAELVMPKKVKGTYLKAVTKTHPDKIPGSLALEKKMIAENVFSRLSLAWEKFKTENDIR